MPTVFSHAVFASAIGSVFPSSNLPARFWILTSICAVVPDLDVIGFAFGVQYESMLGHRGITHSVAFAIILGSTVSVVFFSGLSISKWKLASYFAAVTVSHPLLDMLTNGGLGVALFAPFSNERFFFPWRPIEVSPIGASFFSDRGLRVIESEVLWIWLPSLAILAASWSIRRKWR